MRKLLFFILLLSSLTLHSQKFDFKVKAQVTHAVDLAVLTGVTAYWITGDNVQPDKVIHFLFGYFSTKAMFYILEPLDLPRGLKIGTPILVFTGLALFKEYMLDSSPDINGDFKAGMYGCGIAIVSFNVVYTIPYKHKGLQKWRKTMHFVLF